jgi:hypothetical protein
LRPRLQPITRPDDQRLARLIADLDAERFTVRDQAEKELEQLGEVAGAACRQALAKQPSLETRRRLERLREKQVRTTWSPSPEGLRRLRALEVLERAGTAKAREVLAIVAGGAPEARFTQEAKAALSRLSP